ncbi:MAG: hypothetical protein EZS28_045599, partial [Streblomastix strix]
MADLDSEYLKEAVGETLAEALASVTIYQPSDPIEYVGRFLLQHVRNKRRHEKEKALEEEANRRIEEAEKVNSHKKEAAAVEQQVRHKKIKAEVEKKVEFRANLLAIYKIHESEKDEEIAKKLSDSEEAVRRYHEELKARQERAEERERRKYSQFRLGYIDYLQQNFKF